MAGESLPYFKFFVSDWLSDFNVRAMTPAERGFYVDLLAFDWSEDGIPDSPEKMARVLGVDAGRMRDAWGEISDRFVPHPEKDGYITNKRLLKERNEIRSAAEKRSRRARKAANARWESERQSESNADAMLDASDTRSREKSEDRGQNTTPPKSPPRQNGGGEKGKSTAEDDWSIVMRKLRNRNEPCLSELTEDGSYALEQIGGLDTLTGASKKDVRHIRRDFLEAHPAY